MTSQLYTHKSFTVSQRENFHARAISESVINFGVNSNIFKQSVGLNDHFK